jgi:hypothetical protein
VASRGTTFAKQDRDRAKKAKAAEKRERREAKDAESAAQADDVVVEVGDDMSAAALLRLVEELHEGFAAKRISFEDFEARKTELMEKLSVS